MCNKTISIEDWKLGENHWWQNSSMWQDFTPTLTFLPPIKRRRLNEFARLFFESAWDLSIGKDNLPVVYASQNGEINRSFALWQDLLQDGDVSPTSFSLSVHNALIGQWSELKKIKNEMTAITAQDNFEMALLEANLLLNEGHQQVLVIVAEYPLAEKYDVYPVTRQPFAYALAMIIESGNQYHLSLYSQQAPQSRQNFTKIDSSLTWVQHQHLGSTDWQTKSSKGYWQWHKN